MLAFAQQNLPQEGGHTRERRACNIRAHFLLFFLIEENMFLGSIVGYLTTKLEGLICYVFPRETTVLRWTNGH